VWDTRTELVIVAGLAADAVTKVVDMLTRCGPGTVAVHHDLRHLPRGTVTRRLRTAAGDDAITAVELVHGCVSCTLREDLLPLLADHAARSDVQRVVLHLDAALEPETICWALRHVVLADAAVAERLRIAGVITVVDINNWLAAATGDESLADRGLALGPDDDRTLAQVAVGQVEFADTVLLTGIARDAWTTAKTTAVLDRLAPTGPRARLENQDPAALLAAIPADARCGRGNDPHGPILRGQPPLDRDCGCVITLFSERRPFHPARLHAALDTLLDGVVRTRGRIWVATQPNTALWLESAGGGLRIGPAGPWLASVDQATWEAEPPERRAMAALCWDPYYGDRAQDLAILSHDRDPGEITTALQTALLTDRELALGWRTWGGWPDPFASRHTGPCEPGANVST
jgi:G3E family GTPase